MQQNDLDDCNKNIVRHVNILLSSHVIKLMLEQIHVTDEDALDEWGLVTLYASFFSYSWLILTSGGVAWYATSSVRVCHVTPRSPEPKVH